MWYQVSRTPVGPQRAGPCAASDGRPAGQAPLSTRSTCPRPLALVPRSGRADRARRRTRAHDRRRPRSLRRCVGRRGCRIAHPRAREDQGCALSPTAAALRPAPLPRCHGWDRVASRAPAVDRAARYRRRSRRRDTRRQPRAGTGSGCRSRTQRCSSDLRTASYRTHGVNIGLRRRSLRAVRRRLLGQGIQDLPQGVHSMATAGNLRANSGCFGCRDRQCRGRIRQWYRVSRR